jgi:hypothetical protein
MRFSDVPIFISGGEKSPPFSFLSRTMLASADEGPQA